MSRRPRAVHGRASRTARWLAPIAALAWAGCHTDRLPTDPDPQVEAQLTASAASGATVGADDWIVVFKAGTTDPPGLARRLVAANGGSIRFTYSHAIRGFAGNLPPQSIEAIRANPNVAYVERDGLMQADVGSWGLDRIDQRDLPLDSSYFASFDGSGVDVYIIDTGIDYATYSGGEQFGSRLDQIRDHDFIDNDDDASDCHGHGTHVSGTVGSTGYGVAPGVTLIGVRVLNCQGSGTYAQVIAGIDYVAATATGPSVANMSLGGGYSSAVNDAVNNAVDQDRVVFAVSSGNSNADACGYSPASAASAITVNASTSSDARSSFSNYGTCTDIFAPGSSITSTIMGGGTQAWSGTSMASPHVAGVAALLLQELGDASPGTVWTAMQQRATPDKISGAGSGTPNLLLYSGDGTGGGDPCSGGCPDVEVDRVSVVTVKTNRGNNGSGTITVWVTEVGGGPLGEVTVRGSWTVNGTQDYMTSSGVTGTDGSVTLSTGGIRFATDFDFCVTGLSGTVHDVTTYSSTEPCAGYDSGSGPSNPPGGDPVVGAPQNLTVSAEQKGRNSRANLSWTGGAASVDVYEGQSRIASGISNSGSYTDNLGKDASGTFIYHVCNAETDECTTAESVTI